MDCCRMWILVDHCGLLWICCTINPRQSTTNRRTFRRTDPLGADYAKMRCRNSTTFTWVLASPQKRTLCKENSAIPVCYVWPLLCLSDRPVLPPTNSYVTRDIRSIIVAAIVTGCGSFGECRRLSQPSWFLGALYHRQGDSSSQWETPIFGSPQTENPLTDLDKISPVITSPTRPLTPNLVIIGSVGACPHIGEVVNPRVYFFVFF